MLPPKICYNQSISLLQTHNCQLSYIILQKTGLLNFTQGSYKFYVGSPAGSHLSKLVATPAHTQTHAAILGMLGQRGSDLILFQNGIRSHARWRLVKTVTSILFKCANYWHIIVINTSRTHYITVFSTMHHERCSSNMYKTNSELAFGDHSTRRTRSKNSASTFHEAWDSFQRCRRRNERRN